MNNDQVFQPGDKVMKVCGHRTTHNRPPAFHSARRGVVYNVERCWRGERLNLTTFTGDPEAFTKCGRRIGRPAYCFRRVEEIKLCIEAVKKADALVKQEGET